MRRTLRGETAADSAAGALQRSAALAGAEGGGKAVRRCSAESGGLSARLSYQLIDEARLKLHPVDSVRTAVEALFRLEHGRTPEDLRRVIRALNALLRDPGQEAIRRAFTLWIKRLLRRKAGTSTIAEIEHIEDLLEAADTMLAERIESWFDEAARKGIQQ